MNEEKQEASIGAFKIVKVQGKIVLVRHAKDKLLSLPGGGFKAGETPDLAIQREAWEEADVRRDAISEHIGTFFLHKKPGTVYLFFGEEEEFKGITNDPKEISEVILVDPKNLPKDVYPAQAKMINRWIKGNLGNRGHAPFDLL